MSPISASSGRVRRLSGLVLTAMLATALFVPPAAAATTTGSSAGVPVGERLSPSGSIVVTKPGTVLRNLDIQGCVTVKADDVTIVNSRIRCARPSSTVAVLVPSGVRGLVIEDSEIDGTGGAQVGVGWSNYTLRRVNIHHVNDGARFGHNVLIEDSWIHDLSRSGDLHPDAVQTTSASNTVIRRNVLSSLGADGRDLGNAAVMLGSETGTRKVVNVTIEDNVLIGGNYTVNVRGDINASNVVIQNNTFVPGSRYGQAQLPDSVPLGAGNKSSTGDLLRTNRAK